MPQIESTFYSDGKRQITVTWDSSEGERATLEELYKLIDQYLLSKGLRIKED